VPILKPDQARGFSFQSVIRFERLETMGGNSANQILYIALTMDTLLGCICYDQI
jgi:hypothetical protein